MVDLPRVPRRLALVEEPKSSLSRGDIEAPYQIFARGMNEVGGALNEFAKTHAEDAGRNAVTTDADGTLQVQRLPFVGDAATLFDRGVKTGAMARADGQADRDLLDLREKFQNDPDGFRKAAEAYRDQKVTTANGVSSAVGTALRSSIESKTTSIYGGLLSQFRTNELHRAHDSIDARLTAIGDDMEVLARNGGANSPEFAKLRGNMDALLKEKTDNPLFRYPSEKADLFRDAMITRAQGAAVLDQTERVYRERGFDAARDYLRGTVREMEKTLKQSNKIELEGMKWLRGEEAGLRADKDAISKEWAQAKGQAASLDPNVLLDMRVRASQVGNFRVALDIDTHMAAIDVANLVRSLPVGEQVRAARTGVVAPPAMPVDSVIDAAAAKYGIDPAMARRFAQIESGRNPGAVTGSYKGLFQLSDSEFAKHGGGDIFKAEDNANAAMKKLSGEVERFRGQYGRAPEAWELYLVHQQGEGGFAAHSGNPSAPAWQNMLSTAEGRQKGDKGEAWAKKAIWGNIPDRDKARFGSVENVSSQQFMDIWRARAGGSGDIGNLQQSPEGLLAMRMIKKDLGQNLGDRLTVMREKIGRGQFPNEQEVLEIGQMASVVGNESQRRHVAEMAAISQYGQDFQKLSAPERDAAIAQWDERIKSGAPEAESKLAESLRTADKQISAAYKDDPYLAFPRFSRSEAARATPPMDMANPQQMAVVSDFRLKQQPIMRAEEGLGPVSIFTKAEAESFRGALANADAKGTAGLLGVLGRLPDDVLGATLANEDVKGAISGATRATDPAKYNVAMTAMDQLYARSPHEFVRRFGEDAFHALANWQNKLRFVSPNDLAAERSRIEDPSQAQARKRAEDQGHEIARKETPDKVVAHFDTSYGPTPGFIARNVTKTQPLAPVDSGTRAALMGDYDTVFARRYAETGDKDVAAKQTTDLLKTKWQRSDVNGGALMLRAPESVYPEIENYKVGVGPHDWMKQQIEEDLTQYLGIPRRGPAPISIGTPGVPAAGIAGSIIANVVTGRSGGPQWDYTLVTDRQTETEAQGYDKAQPLSETNNPPTYQIMVRDNRRQNPQWDVVRGADGKARRFGFDPDVARAEAEVKFGITRDREQSFLKGHDVEAARERVRQSGEPPPAEIKGPGNLTREYLGTR